MTIAAATKIITSPNFVRVCRRLAFCVLSIAGALFAICYLGSQSYHWQAFVVQLRAYPAWHGETCLVFNPVGEVHARTHGTPIVLEATLRSVSLDRLQHLLTNLPSRSTMEHDLADTARVDFGRFALHLVLVGAAGAFIAPLMLRPRRVVSWLIGPVIGAVTVASLLYSTSRVYNPHAFREATYVGSLREAGPILSLARTAFNNAHTLTTRLKTAAANLDVLYGRIDGAPGIIEDDHAIHVLHISDIHNNTAAVAYVHDLVERFHIDFVIDTGDLSDYGSAVESQLSTGIGKLGVPYLFVAGNHDSQATVAAVRKNANAKILDGVPLTVDGLTVLGLPDPSSARAGVGSVDTSDAAIDAAASRLDDDYVRSKVPPEIVCVHNPRDDANILGRAPVILCGHLHRAYIETSGNSVVCNAGTTGGAGLRYLDRREGVPLSAAVLTFSMPPHPHLVAIDQVALDGSLDQYSITRRTFTHAGSESANPIESGVRMRRPTVASVLSTW